MTLGWDAAGLVEETGSNVTGFKKGDAVYGVPNFPGNGSYAEYCAAKASQFALKPTSLSFNEATDVILSDAEMNRLESIIPLGTETGDRYDAGSMAQVDK